VAKRGEALAIAHEGYAYQLCECTEILLRQTLLMLLEDQRLFDVFVDSRKLDKYFVFSGVGSP
jgi:hypothetical protein